MSKAKFDRGKAKIHLEDVLIDTVQKFFQVESEKAQKNQMKSKFREDLPKIEGSFKTFENIRTKLLSLNQEIDNHAKLKAGKKQEFKKIINNFHEAVSEFLSAKMLPVKLNNSLLNEINKADQEISYTIIEVRKLKGVLFCGAGARKGVESHFSDLKSMSYFWQGILKCEAQEGVEEIHYAPVLNEMELRHALKDAIDKNFPHEQTQIIKEEKIQYKYIEKSVPVHDNVRLAHELLFGLGRPQEISQAITFYYEEAEKNHNICACNALGQIYYEGVFVPKDINKSYSFYVKSANQEDSEALYRLGTLFEQGYLNDVNQSLEEKEVSFNEEHIKNAKKYYEKSAEGGHLDALTDLGYLYQMGIRDPNNQNHYIEEPDLKKAIHYYKKAKKRKFPRALNNLGRLYIENPLTDERVFGDNLRKGVKYLEIASELGNIKALYNLGVCYEQGKGVPQNHEKARSLFKEAAHKGDLNAKLFYVVYLLKNANYEDREEDFVESSFILQEIVAKDPNMAEAYFYLGYLYENGFGVDKNLSYSLNYYNKAALLDHASSLNKLGDFFHSGIGVQRRNLSKAIQYYESAASFNNTDALINLGALYETGCQELTQDTQKCIFYYETAAKLGDSRGYLNLGHILETLKKDEQEAIRNYEQAAEMGNEIAKNILALKGKTFIPSMKKKNNASISNISKILQNNSSHIGLEDINQNSFLLNQSKMQNKIKNNAPLPLISSYISSGMPKQLMHRQMAYDVQMSSLDGKDINKGKFGYEENRKSRGSEKKEKKPTGGPFKENVPNNKIYK